MNRRHFLGAIGVPAWTASAVALRPEGLLRALSASAAVEKNRTSSEMARDEDYWFEIQQAFTADRSLVNLNNGGVSPSPAVVQEAMKRYLDYSNTAPSISMWRILEPQREAVRARLARVFGSQTEEIAFTRNASEGPPDLPIRDRSQSGRRGAHDDPGLSQDDHHLQTTRAPRRIGAQDSSQFRHPVKTRPGSSTCFKKTSQRGPGLS